MRSSPADTFLSAVLLAIAVCLAGCQKHPEQAEAPTEPYIETAGALGFDIIPLASSDGSPRWLAAYSDEGRTTKFSFEFGSMPSTDSGSAPATGKGRFVAEEESDPVPLLSALKKTLQAKRLPAHTEKSEDVPFSFLLIGENQSRSSDGSFSPNPKGNWTATKIFLANDTAEVYFNFNPVIHKAEFAVKDAKFGDRVLAELARVF